MIDPQFTELATDTMQPACKLMRAMLDAVPGDTQQLISAVLDAGGRVAIEVAVDSDNLTHISFTALTPGGRHIIAELPSAFDDVGATMQ